LSQLEFADGGEMAAWHTLRVATLQKSALVSVFCRSAGRFALSRLRGVEGLCM